MPAHSEVCLAQHYSLQGSVRVGIWEMSRNISLAKNDKEKSCVDVTFFLTKQWAGFKVSASSCKALKAALYLVSQALTAVVWHIEYQCSLYCLHSPLKASLDMLRQSGSQLFSFLLRSTTHTHVRTHNHTRTYTRTLARTHTGKSSELLIRIMFFESR